MKKFVIRGGCPLSGSVAISGSKNATLPILAASLLSSKPVILKNVPSVSDIAIMCEILTGLGCIVSKISNDCLSINPDHLVSQTVPYQLAGQMRGSFLVAGPMLARTGSVTVAMPGGCAIGARPIDLHIKGLASLGAKIQNSHGSILATAKRLKGAKIYLDFPSVGATENILCAAVLAKGITVIENAAAEPEIVDLAKFLISMGAKIEGAGTDTITIEGVDSLTGTEYTIISDRIEAGTLLVAAAITGGEITLTNILPDDLKPMTAKLKEMHLLLTTEEDSITVKAPSRLRGVDIKTLPFPGFPTDMQAQMTALLSIADGTSMVTETIFENRFMHIAELNRMGAAIKVAGRCAVIEGKKKLVGTKVKATDLRAGAALVLAALAAAGDTEISDIHHIQRGYMNLDEKLRTLGAEISMEKDI